MTAIKDSFVKQIRWRPILLSGLILLMVALLLVFLVFLLWFFSQQSPFWFNQLIHASFFLFAGYRLYKFFHKRFPKTHFHGIGQKAPSTGLPESSQNKEGFQEAPQGDALEQATPVD